MALRDLSTSEGPTTVSSLPTVCDSTETAHKTEREEHSSRSLANAKYSLSVNEVLRDVIKLQRWVAALITN